MNGLGCACATPANLAVAPALRGLGNYRRGYSGVGDLDTTTTTYVVQPGDSLSLITWRFGRPAEDVPLLFNVNAVAGIVKNHHEISVGQRLWLPLGWPTAPMRTDQPTPAWKNQAAAALRSFGLTPRPELVQKPPAEEPLTPDPGPPPAPPASSNVGLYVGGAVVLLGAYLLFGKS